MASGIRSTTSYLDRIIDSYLELGIRPFLELGFMPELKTGDRTVFYWKGNYNAPASYEKWADLVKALEHLIEGMAGTKSSHGLWRFGMSLTFLSGPVPMEEYFKLYDYSAQAVRANRQPHQVGGPAICGVETEKWLKVHRTLHYRMTHPRLHQSPLLPHISRPCGHYTYHTLSEPTRMIENSKKREPSCRTIATGDMPHHIKFNSSYNPICPVHDTTYQAAYIAILSEAG